MEQLTIDEIKAELHQIGIERKKLCKMEDIEESLKLDKPLYERERELLNHPLLATKVISYWEKRDIEIKKEVEEFKKAGGYVSPFMLWSAVNKR